MVITDVNSVTYLGNGSRTSFPFTFRIIEATDIQLLLVNADGTEQAITSDYYVDMNADTVHYPGYAPGAEPPAANQPAPVQAGQKLIIYRSLPVTQEKDLGDKWPFHVIELALDKLTMLIQDIKDIANRCLKVRVSDVQDGFDATITPEPGMAIQIKEDGKGFECVESPSNVLAECKEVLADTEVVAEGARQSAESAAVSADSATSAAQAASASAAQAVQANNSAQGALVDADALLNATRGYISAATVDGVWNSATTYNPGDVTMTVDGATYRCIQTSTNNPPVTSPSYWAQITTTELLTFEIDSNGDLTPRINPAASQNWDVDEQGDIMPASLSTLTVVDNQEF